MTKMILKSKENGLCGEYGMNGYIKESYITWLYTTFKGRKDQRSQQPRICHNIGWEIRNRNKKENRHAKQSICKT